MVPNKVAHHAQWFLMLSCSTRGLKRISESFVSPYNYQLTFYLVSGSEQALHAYVEQKAY